MPADPCADCTKIINNEGGKHANLEYQGVHKTVSFHGSNDDERSYRCKVCNTQFIGDSGGIWKP